MSPLTPRCQGRQGGGGGTVVVVVCGDLCIHSGCPVCSLPACPACSAVACCIRVQLPMTMDVAVSLPKSITLHCLPTDCLRKAPGVGFWLLTSFSSLLVNCMCCMLCCPRLNQHTPDSSHVANQVVQWEKEMALGCTYSLSHVARALPIGTTLHVISSATASTNEDLDAPEACCSTRGRRLGQEYSSHP